MKEDIDISKIDSVQTLNRSRCTFCDKIIKIEEIYCYECKKSKDKLRG